MWTKVSIGHKLWTHCSFSILHSLSLSCPTKFFISIFKEIKKLIALGKGSRISMRAVNYLFLLQVTMVTRNTLNTWLTGRHVTLKLASDCGRRKMGNYKSLIQSVINVRFCFSRKSLCFIKYTLDSLDFSRNRKKSCSTKHNP